MFDDILKDKANDHEAPVPPDAWDNIVRKKRRRRFIIFWWTSILLLCGAATTIYLLNTRNPGMIKDSEKNTVAKQPGTTINENISAVKQHDGDNDIKSNEEKTVAQNIPPAIDKKENRANQLPIADNINANDVKPSKNNAAYKPKPKPASTLAVNKKITKKTKGKQVTKSKPADAGEIANDQQKNDLVTNEAELVIIQQAEKKEEINNNEQLSDKAVPALKDTAIEQKKENATKQKKKSWFLDISISPLFPIQQYDESVSFNRTLSLNNELTEFSGKAVKTTLDPSVAFSLAVRKEIDQKLTVGIGLQYLQLKENSIISGEETNTKTSVIQRLIDGNNGPELVNDTIQTVTKGTRNITATHSYHFFSMPVLLQYNFIQNRNWSFGAVGGVYFTVAANYKNEINKDAQALLLSTGSTENKTSMSVDLFAGVRLGKTLGKRTELFVMPTIRLNPGGHQVKDNLFNKKIQQVGINFGLSYRIN